MKMKLSRRFFLCLLLTASCLPLSAYCLQPTTFSAQTGEAQPQASPSPSPSPAPSPSPTPITGLHQWGAVTLFHGLPSDRLHAIAQTRDGSMWFGTEAGLAKFDGRRTQTVNDPALPPGRVLALQTDSDGTLWVGTESGASRLVAGEFQAIKETAGQTVSSIIAPQPGRVVMGTEQGQVFECRLTVINEGTVTDSVTGRRSEQPTTSRAVLYTHALLDQPLQSTDKDHPGPLVITSLSAANDNLLAGTLSRGVLQIENGTLKEVRMRPMAYFVNALERDKAGTLWVGARGKKEEPGALSGNDVSNLRRNEAQTGSGMALKAIGNEVWVGTDGRGVFRMSGAKAQRFTFDGTAGGLRSDHVYAIFADREGVIWFGTDRGVCRFDPHAPRVESVGDNSDSNFVRALYQTSNGRTLAGTNRGLFVYDLGTSSWNPVAELAPNIIDPVAEDKSGRLLVASASGFYVAPRQWARLENQTFPRLESSSGNADAAGRVRAITQFHRATYFPIFGRGIERLDSGRTSITWPANVGTGRDVISLLADGEARLLIGTAKEGVLSSDGKTIELVPGFETLKGPPVRSMARTPDGSLWFGTANGVYFCNPKGTWTW